MKTRNIPEVRPEPILKSASYLPGDRVKIHQYKHPAWLQTGVFLGFSPHMAHAALVNVDGTVHSVYYTELTREERR